MTPLIAIGFFGRLITGISPPLTSGHTPASTVSPRSPCRCRKGCRCFRSPTD